MPLVNDLSVAQLGFQIAERDADELLVVRYRGTEGLSQLYRFEIELVAEQVSVAFDDIVGSPAVLTVGADYGQRWFHGIVSRFERTGETAERVADHVVDRRRRGSVVFRVRAWREGWNAAGWSARHRARRSSCPSRRPVRTGSDTRRSARRRSRTGRRYRSRFREIASG